MHKLNSSRKVPHFRNGLCDGLAQEAGTERLTFPIAELIESKCCRFLAKVRAWRGFPGEMLPSRYQETDSTSVPFKQLRQRN